MPQLNNHTTAPLFRAADACGGVQADARAAPPPQTKQSRHLFPRRLAAWQERGLSFRAAVALATAGCDTAEEVARLGRSYFEGRPNCGERTLAELAKLAGWPPKRRTAVDAIAGALSMAMDPDEAREAATDCLMALRRNGFVVTTSRQVEVTINA